MATEQHGVYVKYEDVPSAGKALAEYTNEDLMALVQPTHDRLRGTFIMIDDMKVTLDEPTERAGWWSASVSQGGKVRTVEVWVIEGSVVPIFAQIGEAKLSARQAAKDTQAA